MILTHVINVQHLANKNTDSDKEGFEATPSITGVRVNIQPASKETVVMSEGAFGKTFSMFAPTTASGIKQGDKVTVISGLRQFDTFIVNGKEDWSMGGPLPHYEYVLFTHNV